MGRFISPDTILDGLNRYAYCGNNPVRFVDPTGHFWLELGLALVCAYIGGVAANNWQWNPLQWDWSNYQTWLGMGIGAMVGGASAFVIGGLNSTSGGSVNNTNKSAGMQTNPYNTSVPDWMNMETDGDPESCAELLKEIMKYRNLLREHYDAMREDEHHLYERPPTEKTPWGTWKGHQEEFENYQEHLRNLLRKFQNLGCGSGLIPVDAWDLATREVPVQPAPKVDYAKMLQESRERATRDTFRAIREFFSKPWWENGFLPFFRVGRQKWVLVPW